MIQLSCDLIDREINQLRTARVLRVVRTRKEYTDYGDVLVRVVETNRRPLAEATELLLDAKAKLRSMQHSPISEILSFVEVLEGQENQINLKEVEEAEMNESEYVDERRLIEGDKPLGLSPEYHQMAEKCYLDSKFEAAKQILKDTEKWLMDQAFKKWT